VNVVDSSGWLEYFADGPNADFFAAAVESSDALVVPRAAPVAVAPQPSRQECRGRHPSRSSILLQLKTESNGPWSGANRAPEP
jgi:hypothetical protein